MRDKFIFPLCSVAKAISLFGNEWFSESEEVLRVKDLVVNNFEREGRYLICDQPCELIDAPLFWTGGSSKCFHLIQVLVFDIKFLDTVLNILGQHKLAGQQSSRSGGEWTRINSFSKAIVKNGGCAVIVYGREAEIFFPIEYKDTVESYGRQVLERMRQEMLFVRTRAQSIKS